MVIPNEIPQGRRCASRKVKFGYDPRSFGEKTINSREIREYYAFRKRRGATRLNI